MVYMDPSDFGSKLRQFRKDAELSQDDLAKRAGVHRQAVARIELGKNHPTWPTIVALTRALGLTPNDFLPDGPKRRK